MENPNAGNELPDILFRCKHCTYVYPLQQTPQNEGELACAHCGATFELDEEVLSDLEIGA